MADLTPMTERQMLELAARAVGKIDRDGIRGVTRITADETVAMALTLVCLGLIPIAPGAIAPETLFTPRKEE